MTQSKKQAARGGGLSRFSCTGSRAELRLLAASVLAAVLFSVQLRAAEPDPRLTAFTVKAENYRVRAGDGPLSFGTRMRATYRTRGLGDLEAFGIVQYIRGCQFSSRLANGKIIKALDVSRDHFGRDVVYRHPDWVIDGALRDPLDWGYLSSGISRHSYYQWNRGGGAPDEAGARYLGQEFPDSPSLFVTDRPGVAFYDARTGTARNVSLRFRTCLYRAGDVPRAAGPGDGASFGAPLACYEWASSFVFDHLKGRMESPAALDPVCLN